MTTISVVYHSGTGHTRKMAEAVLEGAASISDIEAQMIAIEGKDIVEGRWQNEPIMERLDRSDAMIFGSPTYMGCVSGQMKSFLDATSERYLSRAWVDKIAAAFTVSAGLSGDKLSTLTAIAICMMQHGMIWVGLVRLKKTMMDNTPSSTPWSDLLTYRSKCEPPSLTQTVIKNALMAIA